MSGSECEIRIEGIEVFAHHGVLPEEKERGQEFVIDVVLELDGPPPADDLSSTVDYAWVAQEAARIASGEPCDLIETLAFRIASAMLDAGPVRHARVTVRKPAAPMPVDVSMVSVTVTARRDGVPREGE